MRYDFEMFGVDINVLHHTIMSSNTEYDEILALARGGAVPGVWLSHRLGIPVRIIEVSLRDYQQVDTHQLVQIEKGIKAGKKYLLVDDMVDSGKTISLFFTLTGNMCENQPHLAVLIHNISCPLPITPRFAARTIDRRFDKQWVTFWWEE